MCCRLQERKRQHVIEFVKCGLWVLLEYTLKWSDRDTFCQEHFEVYFENPSLKVNRKRGSTCLLFYHSPFTSVSSRVTRVPIEETKVVSDSFR